MTTTTLPLTLEEANHIRLKQGEFFGYPKCCVHSFINYMSGKGKRTPLQNKTSHLKDLYHVINMQLKFIWEK